MQVVLSGWLAAVAVAADAPSIKVVGVAEERVPPDQVTFRCAVRSTGAELEAVARHNRERAAAVTAMLRGLGLGEAELKTSLDGVSYLLLDFAGLEYISSAGLRVLLSTQKVMNKQGKMVIRHVNETILEVFEVTGFTDILTIE